MDITRLFEGTLSLYRCYGCTFEIVRRPADLVGRYKLTRTAFPPPALPA